MTFGLVLGAGGVVGMAYHAGALRALEQVAGIDPGDADLVVGTSAGSVIGSHLRCDWTVRDLWDFAMGTHPLVAELSPEEVDRRERAILEWSWDSGPELVRRLLGSVYVLGRCAVRLPMPEIPAVLRRSFPGGLCRTDEAEQQISEHLPDEWPDDALWLCAVDIQSGRRVVLGRRGAPDLPLPQAVLASCAIPGVFPPVRADGVTLVDGGAHSTTNLDLAARAGCSLIIGVAPMAYDPADPPLPHHQLARRRATVSLHREMVTARGRGAEVLLIRPSAAEVADHGLRFMRPDSTEEIARAAYDSVARMLESARFRRVLGEQLAA